MTVVVDASVVVKWLLRDPEREDLTERATRIMTRVLEGREPIVQPAHWVLEVAAVLARLSPRSAVDDVLMLQGLELPVDDGALALGRACQLAVDLRQHVFDTLYHAVALELPDCTLITADERYWAAAQPVGRIVRLSDWQDRP